MLVIICLWYLKVVWESCDPILEQRPSRFHFDSILSLCYKSLLVVAGNFYGKGVLREQNILKFVHTLIIKSRDHK